MMSAQISPSISASPASSSSSRKGRIVISRVSKKPSSPNRVMVKRGGEEYTAVDIEQGSVVWNSSSSDLDNNPSFAKPRHSSITPFSALAPEPVPVLVPAPETVPVPLPSPSSSSSSSDEEGEHTDTDVGEEEDIPAPLSAKETRRHSSSVSARYDKRKLSVRNDSFMMKREEKKAFSFYRIVAPGAVCLGLGFMGFAPILIFYSNSQISVLVYTILTNVCFLLLVVGLILLSMIPSDDIILEKFLGEHKISAAILNSMGLSITVPFLAYPPYIGAALPVFLGFIMAANAMPKTISDQFTCCFDSNSVKKFKDIFKLPFSFTAPTLLIVWPLCVWPYCLYMVYMLNTCHTDPNKYVLLGTNTVSSDCNLWFMWVLSGLVSFLGQIIIAYIWYEKHKKLWLKRQGDTTGLFDALYLLIILFGVGAISAGGTKAVIGNTKIEENTVLFTGFVLLIPLLLVLSIGRKKMYHMITAKFENEQSVFDGAHLAELLQDSNEITIKQIYYVHLDDVKLSKNENYSKKDHLHHFVQGKVVAKDIDKKTFDVSYMNPHDKTNTGVELIHTLNLPKFYHADKLKKLGLERLRLVEWEKLNDADNGGGVNLFQKSIRAVSVGKKTKEEEDIEFQKLYNISRKVKHNERIDYFISHSWSDDGTLKFEALTEIAEKFYDKNHRYPTFWFDKVCIFQPHLTDGLRLLAINIAQCKKVLILQGDTYISRLWCLWEICTCTLARIDHMETKLEFKSILTATNASTTTSTVPTTSNNDILLSSSNPSPTTTTTTTSRKSGIWNVIDGRGVEENASDRAAQDMHIEMLNQLKQFQLSNASCYDPNEEYKLRKVIEALGTDKFHEQIHSLAETLLRKPFSTSGKRSGSGKH